jgi:dTDP-4-amino-4,6-dideoxygalactose transaminase
MSARGAASLDDLAIFSGWPAFDEPVHVGRPNIGDRERLEQRVADALDSRWLTNDGPMVRELEGRVAELAGVEHCVAVSSCTVGLQLVARALGLAGEIVVPSFTFIATAHALRWLGLTPVFCEVDRRGHTLDPDAVGHAITPHTTAIVGVHLWGRACDVQRLEDVAGERDLALIFDAAHALGCSSGGRPIGGRGNAEVFSFHATKVASAGEGGAITTNDSSLAERLRLMRNFGFVHYDTVAGLGTNAKMSELAAALGLTSLDSLDEFIAVNRSNYVRYAYELDGLSGIALLPYDEAERNNYHYVVLEIAPGPTAEQQRDELVAVLHAENVLARRYFSPGCHRAPPYAEEVGAPRAPLPLTEDLCSRVLVLPTGTAVGDADVQSICSIIRCAMENSAELHERLARSPRRPPPIRETVD